SYYNRIIMSKSLTIKAQSDLTTKTVERIFENIQLMDISARGYALIRQPQYLFHSIDNALNYNAVTYRQLDSLFAIQGIDTMQSIPKVKASLDAYTQWYVKMVTHLKNEEMDAYLSILEKDYGKHFWQEYTPFMDQINAFEAKVVADAQAEYQAAVNRNSVVQFLLVLLGLPTLILIYFRLNKDSKERASLFSKLQENNRRYLFNEGRDAIASADDERQILDNSIRSLEKAANFVNQISEGNYEVQWDGLNAANASVNQQNLAGRLVFMRDEMKRVKEEDRKRIWTTEGLSRFSEIVRTHQGNLDDLTYQALTFLVKYTGSQQGSLFIPDNTDETSLKLAACYAFDRKKHLNKKVTIGDGLLGQTFLEGNTTMLTKLPSGYISITSGLGDAPPSCLIIVPFKHNDAIQAVMEMATFHAYEPYQIAFLEKAGEFVASAITTAQSNERTKTLIDQMTSQTEQLRAQEEELRQNLEELEATQEEMRRKETELERKLQAMQVSA
ncbi:MAG TPA: GAF domain-containing protein, partial [Chryseosolibacter sp.]|nr:GAF domain-containing protein [Chryseosolibacter sp.]